MLNIMTTRRLVDFSIHSGQNAKNTEPIQKAALATSLLQRTVAHVADRAIDSNRANDSFAATMWTWVINKADAIYSKAERLITETATTLTTLQHTFLTTRRASLSQTFNQIPKLAQSSSNILVMKTSAKA